MSHCFGTEQNPVVKCPIGIIFLFKVPCGVFL